MAQQNCFKDFIEVPVTMHYLTNDVYLNLLHAILNQHQLLKWLILK